MQSLHVLSEGKFVAPYIHGVCFPDWPIFKEYNNSVYCFQTTNNKLKSGEKK